MACGSEGGLISVDDALASIVNAVQVLPQHRVSVQNSLSNYLAENVYAQVDLPSFRQSAVDGYALCSAASNFKEMTFSLVAEIRAGQPQNTVLTEGQAQRIFTGAAVPKDCTTVARQEIVKKINTTHIQITSQLERSADTREQGEEIGKGQLLAQTGQYLNVGAIAALCMAGVQQVSVYAKPKVAVVITGDEVAQQADAAQGAIIHDANGPMLKAWLATTQGIDAAVYHIADTASALENCFAQLKDCVDVIISTGGVSVGDYDLVRPCAFAQDFQEIFWKVKQKPGKPLFFAKTSNHEKPCYLLGLPGNPAAVYVGLQVYAKTLLNALQGQTQPLTWFHAQLKHNLKPDSRERFLRMFAQVDAGVIYLHALQNQQSHMLSNLMQANCLVRIPENAAVKTGDLLQTIWLMS